MRRCFLFVLVMVMIIPALVACNNQQTTNPTVAVTTLAPATTDAETTAPTAEPTAAPTSIADLPPDGAEHTTILLMGVGESDLESDQNPYALTHILITLDPAGRAVRVTTLPYNLAVMAYENGQETEQMQLQQVCSALGPEGVKETIEKNFNVSIDYWVAMGMMGLVDIVDALNGVEIDVDRMSINTAAEYLLPMLGIVWEQVESLGLQVLSGIQTIGFFCDTYSDDSEDFIVDEEMMFRDRHPKIINAVVTAILGSELTADDLVTIAQNTDNRYLTDIPEEKWKSLAELALYCADNPVEYLHVPETIEKTDINGWESIAFDEKKDVESVVAFIGEK